MNSDHRAVKAKLMMGRKRRKRAWKPLKPQTGWAPTDREEYARLLDEKILNIKREKRLRGEVHTASDQYDTVVKQISEIARQCQQPTARNIKARDEELDQ